MCPPASMPWAIMASTPATAALMASSTDPTFHTISQDAWKASIYWIGIGFQFRMASKETESQFERPFNSCDKEHFYLTWWTTLTPALWSSSTFPLGKSPHDTCKNATFSSRTAWRISSSGNARRIPTPKGLSVSSLVRAIILLSRSTRSYNTPEISSSAILNLSFAGFIIPERETELRNKTKMMLCLQVKNAVSRKQQSCCFSTAPNVSTKP